jgi:hypothetical protein
MVRQLAEGIDGRQQENASRRHRLVDCVTEALCSREADTETTFLQELIVLLLRHRTPE